MIGAGTAGAAAALFLARAGHEVVVYERVPEPGPVGAGILLQPTGQRVLHRLGLLEPIRDAGARVAGLTCLTPRGRPVVDIQYRSLAPDLAGLGLHRGVLFETLFQAAQREPGVTIHCGVEIEDLAAAGARNFMIEKGSRVQHGPFDLVVVADGARSQLRDDTDLRKSVHSYPWGALWWIGEDREGAFSDTLFQIADGTRVLLGFLPSGRGPGSAAGPPLVSLFWSARCDRFQECLGEGFQPWKETVVRYAPRSAGFLSRLEAPEALIFSAYLEVRMRRWNTDNVVYLGDAAHAMSPQLGQGCNLALMDAEQLARGLAAGETLAEGLLAYSAARRRHLRFYQFASRLLTLLFQSDYALLGPIRDLGMGLSNRVPFFNRRMVLVMTGMAQGFVGAPLPLPD